MKQELTLGQAIRTRREELGWTQEELARRIGNGVRQAEVSRLEHDRVILPRRRRLEQIAHALNFTVGELLARSGWAGADVAVHTLMTDYELTRASGIDPNDMMETRASAGIANVGLQDAIDRARETMAQSRRILQTIRQNESPSVEPDTD